MKFSIFPIFFIFLIFSNIEVNGLRSIRSPARKFDPNRPTMSNQGQRLSNQQRKANEEVVNSQRNTEFLIIH
ncbi:hypothetical protein L5515_003045 [Caenorhabditis briggsae]|uniref:Secreted protein n=1 Tax=Caenorhabditis briggsae TaxID=6238 RepID=A0AAE9EI52_CAEBR|nr:hypothetical protein L3Y34_000160 [Caenorhabditis briggsae]UMM21311.1 hypothetical protein L5515_003045 [Caenorhabditis briggsae]